MHGYSRAFNAFRFRKVFSLTFCDPEIKRKKSPMARNERAYEKNNVGIAAISINGCSHFFFIFSYYLIAIQVLLAHVSLKSYLKKMYKKPFYYFNRDQKIEIKAKNELTKSLISFVCTLFVAIKT